MPLNLWIFVISGLTKYDSVHMTLVVSHLIKQAQAGLYMVRAGYNVSMRVSTPARDFMYVN